MNTQPQHVPPALTKRFPLLAAVGLVLVVFGCSIYANLSFTVTNRANFRYFPPFKPHVDGNMNRHLGAEYFRIAQSLQAGKGFSTPFPQTTGPTAWMPPLLPALLAGLLWVCDGDRDAVMAVVVFLQVYTLIATGLLAMLLAHRTGRRLGAWVTALVFAAVVVWNFRLCFQMTHDSWLVLLALDLVIAGFCLGRPLARWPVAVAWGAFGGLCALVNPIVALVWGGLSLAATVPQRSWGRFAAACLAAGLVLTPWTVRNYLVFGRLVPVKSNLAYELYQSQCLQPDGLIQSKTFATHPNGSAGRERQEYKSLGEMAFLDRKSAQFWQAVRADPLEFCDRVACRFLGTTLWYVPFDRAGAARRPVVLWLARLTHPLPFLALLVLAATTAWRPLHRAQWAVLAAYLIYLLPYVGASYYERYGLPLLGIKVLLVVWAADRLLSLWSWQSTRDGGQGRLLPAARPVSSGDSRAPHEPLARASSPGL